MINYTPHILIVDDDTKILKLLRKFFEQNNLLVSTAESVQEAKLLIERFVYDLIILDVMLPNITGLEFAKTIKSSGSSVPIVMLTALSEPADRVTGLEAGASDYLVKPFEPKELLIRVRNLIDNFKASRKEENIKRFGASYYNFSTKELVKKQQAVFLSATEQKLLEILLEANSNVVTREELSRAMGGLNLRSVDVQIVRLRNKLEDDPKMPKYLRAIRGQGYAFFT